MSIPTSIDYSSGQVLRPSAAAKYLGVTTSTLARWRVTGEGPRFGKIGPRLIGYSATDLANFVERQKRVSTSEKRGAE